MNKVWEKHKLVFGIAIFAIFILLIFILLYFWFSADGEISKFEVHWPYYIIALTTSIAFIIIAWNKSGEAIKQSRMGYLLRLDERWCSQEIIKAREVIHDLYLTAKEENEKYTNEQIKHEIAISILDLHKNKEKIPEFISLLNFLDFMETIGFIHSKKAFEIEEINELMGNSLVYFFDIFKLYIEYRRKEKDPKFYCYIEKLYLDIRLSKNNSEC